MGLREVWCVGLCQQDGSGANPRSVGLSLSQCASPLSAGMGTPVPPAQASPVVLGLFGCIGWGFFGFVEVFFVLLLNALLLLSELSLSYKKKK